MANSMGCTLADLVRSRGGRMTTEDLFPLIRPVFGMLATLHDSGHIYGSVSPDKIIFENGTVRLAEVTSGETPDSWYYMSPEKVHSGAMGPWSDIYSLGATIYFCVTGNPPPRSIDRELNDTIMMPTRYGAVMTPLQESALMTSLRLSPNERYGSTVKMFEALFGQKLILKKTGTPSAGVPAVNTGNAAGTRKISNSRLIAIIACGAAALVLIVACVVVAFAIFGKPKPSVSETYSDNGSYGYSNTTTVPATAPPAAVTTTAPSSSAATTPPSAASSTPAATVPGILTGPMTRAEFDAAPINSTVKVDTYIQARQNWVENSGSGTASLYTQNEEGGYFILDMKCSKNEYRRLTPGTGIRVTGTKKDWAGEIEIADASFEILSGSYTASAQDLSDIADNDADLRKHMNEFISFSELVILAQKDTKGDNVPFIYGNEGDGSEESSLYFKASIKGRTITFTAESLLSAPGSAVYDTVMDLHIGDTVDIEGFLNWFNGPCPHLTSINIVKRAPADTWLTDLTPEANNGVTIVNDKTGTSNTGEIYTHYMFGKSGSNIHYDLEGKYVFLSGMWAICKQNENTSSKNSVKIYADNNLIFSSPSLTAGDNPVRFRLALNGCRKLMIVFGDGQGAGELGNLKLTPDSKSGSSETSASAWLTDITPTHNSGVSIMPTETGMTNTGIEYSHYIYGKEGAYVIYDLDGKYNTLSGMWAVCYQDRELKNKNTFELRADGEVIYRSEAVTGTDDPKTFVISLNGCRSLRIDFIEGNGAGELSELKLE